MKLLESYSEYKDLIREFREQCKSPFSNVYYMQNDMERYIKLGRVSYEKAECGIVFFFDEEVYYRVCLYVNERAKFTIEKQDKKMLVKNAFRKGKKKEKLVCIEQRLEDLGFKKIGTSVRIQGEVQNLYLQCKKMGRYAERLEKKGYRCVIPDFSMLEEIETIILESGMIKDYQLEYKSDEEKKKMVEKGSYLCIVNEENRVCAGSVAIIGDSTTDGVAVVVKEEYKMHGLTPVLAYYRFKWLYENGFKRCQAWILTSNEPSLKYHQSLGYEFMNEYTDEWILDE